MSLEFHEGNVILSAQADPELFEWLMAVYVGDSKRGLAPAGEFLRSLVKRGLTGVQLAVSDAHPGLKAALAQVLGCPWQRCTVHFLRDCLGHARTDQHGLLGALIRPLFAAASGEEASQRLGEAVAQLERPLPKVAAQAQGRGRPQADLHRPQRRGRRDRARALRPDLGPALPDDRPSLAARLAAHHAVPGATRRAASRCLHDG